MKLAASVMSSSASIRLPRYTRNVSWNSAKVREGSEEIKEEEEGAEGIEGEEVGGLREGNGEGADVEVEEEKGLEEEAVEKTFVDCADKSEEGVMNEADWAGCFC